MKSDFSEVPSSSKFAASLQVDRGNKLRHPAYKGFIVVTIVFSWLLCTVAQLEKYLSMSRAALICVTGCTVVILTLMLLQSFYKQDRDMSWWSLLVAYGLLLSSFAILYPRSQKHEVGKGSDREDALRVELLAVTNHQYPYSVRTFLNHPPTPLPGAMWLASPFYLAGKIALQNLFWAAAFFFFLARFFCRKITALAMITLFMLTALENLNDFDVGGDYVTNILYVVVAIYCFVRVVSWPSRGWLTASAIALLGFALSSRVIYATAILPVLALAVQRTRPRRAFMLVGAVLLVSAVITLPIFYPNIAINLHTQLNQNADKLQFVARYFPPALLQIAGLGIGVSAFFLHMTLRRVYLLVGLSNLVILLPTMGAVVASEGGLRHPLTTDLEYLAASCIFLALWALSSWEQEGLQRELGMESALRASPLLRSA